MRVILVGQPKERERLRLALAGTLVEIVDEAPTLSAARERGATVDAFVVTAPKAETAAASAILVESLTARETEVLQLLAEGMPNKAIATRLGISDQTVKFHVSSICGKLGAVNRTDAVRLAIRRGLVVI